MGDSLSPEEDLISPAEQEVLDLFKAIAGDNLNYKVFKYIRDTSDLQTKEEQIEGLAKKLNLSIELLKTRLRSLDKYIETSDGKPYTVNYQAGYVLNVIKNRVGLNKE